MVIKENDLWPWDQGQHLEWTFHPIHRFWLWKQKHRPTSFCFTDSIRSMTRKDEEHWRHLNKNLPLKSPPGPEEVKRTNCQETCRNQRHRSTYSDIETSVSGSVEAGSSVQEPWDRREATRGHPSRALRPPAAPSCCLSLLLADSPKLMETCRWRSSDRWSHCVHGY